VFLLAPVGCSPDSCRSSGPAAIADLPNRTRASGCSGELTGSALS
jgi:hypothetical protein